jgi:chemotaxis protein MotB
MTSGRAADKAAEHGELVLGKYAGENVRVSRLRLPIAPGWMITYGDIMTLLLTFFVLLLSYSTVQEDRFRRALSSFQEALGMLPEERSLIEFEAIPLIREIPAIPPREIIRRVRNAVYAAGLKGRVKVLRDKDGVRITIMSPILFDSGKADLRGEALSVLDEIIMILKESPNAVVVEGHTDNLPIKTERFPSNWELSTARAISVSRYLFETGGFDPARFVVAGYGQYHPVAPNDSARGRRENRRVELLLKNMETGALESKRSES